MKLGLFSMPLHRPEKPFPQTLEEDREAILLADRLGYAEAWIGEHFTSKVEQITSPLIFLATLIRETRTIRFGTGVINLPHHHPVTIASHAALFDQLAEGRFLFGIGPGGLISDAEMYGHNDVAERQRMMLAAIDIIVALWRGEPPYRFETEWWDIALDESVYPRHGIGLVAKPWQDPHPPIAMAMVSAHSSSASLCGTRGWIPISANFIPSRDVATHWPLYAAAAEKAGRPVDPSVWRVARNLLVTESESRARDILADPDGLFHFYFRYLRSLRRLPEVKAVADAPVEELNALLDVEEAVADIPICGTARTVLDRLVALREEIGAFGTLLIGMHDWEDQDLCRTSMQRLAEEVLPALSQHCKALGD
ncbi:MAG: LLM class flavin-dependent oxidoreductase [Alphaproteobacteria bacterium]|nr:LLM class flavin-dependent oxidoreductase [Alphaproteobacteria bacterium]